MKWGKMRTIKVSPQKFEQAVSQKASNAKFMPIPSSNRKHVFVGLMMAGGVWVSWPDNLSEEEEVLYKERYGSIPDLFTPKTKEASQRYAPPVGEPDWTKAEICRDFLKTVRLGSEREFPLFPIEMNDGRIVEEQTMTDDEALEIARALGKGEQ